MKEMCGHGLQNAHNVSNVNTDTCCFWNKYPFDILSWDILGLLPLTIQGNKYVLIVTDLFTKWTEVFTLKATNSEILARVFVDEVICRYGMPSTPRSCKPHKQSHRITMQGIGNFSDVCLPSSRHCTS